MLRLNLSFEAIGTRWRITGESKLAANQVQSLAMRIDKRIATFDHSFSRFRADSWVTQLAQQAGTYSLPPDGYELLSFYEQLYRATSGLVTPLIGQVMADAGYDAAYSFRQQPLATPPTWDDSISYTRSSLTLARPTLLDFGAAGKGYLVDRIGELLQAEGITDYVIDAGGDIQHRSRTNQPLTVGLENPYDFAEVVGTAKLCNESICASAGSRRKWGEYTHIINPMSLSSPEDVQATWVIAPTTMLADGVATALFFTDQSALRSHFDFSFGLLRPDMALEHSRDFPLQMHEQPA